MASSFMGRGNQYIQLVKVLYCKLPTIGKQLQVKAQMKVFKVKDYSVNFICNFYKNLFGHYK